MKFTTIYKRSAALDNNRKHNAYGGLASRVGDLIEGARINAVDSYVEGTTTEADYDRCAVSSLELLLGCCKDEEVCTWFRKQGFKW